MEFPKNKTVKLQFDNTQPIKIKMHFIPDSSLMSGVLKLRNDIHCQINDGKEYAGATFFLGEEFVRITEEQNGQMINSYYDWENIVSVRTIANNTK